MRELTQIEKRKVKAAGITASLFNGIGSIVKAGLGFVNDLIGNIVTSVFLFKHHNEYKKLEVKIGSDTVKYDRTNTPQPKSEKIEYPQAESLL